MEVVTIFSWTLLGLGLAIDVGFLLRVLVQLRRRSVSPGAPLLALFLYVGVASCHFALPGSTPGLDLLLAAVAIHLGVQFLAIPLAFRRYGNR